MNFFAAMVALWPPKPRELLTQARTGHLAGLVGHVIQIALGIGILVIDRRRHHVVWIASAHTAVSTAPAAPSRWPVTALVELTASFLACAPNTVLIAWVSHLSPSGVEVPCALM